MQAGGGRDRLHFLHESLTQCGYPAASAIDLDAFPSAEASCFTSALRNALGFTCRRPKSSTPSATRPSSRSFGCGL